MESGIYWIWKDRSKGGTPDNYITVSGTEFFDIMGDKAQERYFIWMSGETAADRLYLETSREDYKKWEAEKDHAKYLAKYERQSTIYSLDVAVSGMDEEDGVALGDTVESDWNMDEHEDETMFATFMGEILDDLDPQDRYIAEHRYLADEQMKITEIAKVLGLGYSTVRKRIARIERILIKALEEYNPELTKFYAE